MFCQHALIAYAFPTPTTSHVSLVIQHISCSLTINNMTYTFTKPKRQTQHFVLVEINPHTCKHFCLSSNLSFLAYNLFGTWLLSCTPLCHSRIFYLIRLWDSVLNNSVIFCFVEVAFGTLLHNFGSCYVKLDNVGSCLWQIVR